MSLLTRTVAHGLVDVADVYDQDDTLAHAGLACRLTEPSETSDRPRAEFEARRVLLHDPSYALTDYQYVVIAGTRWNVVAGSLAPGRTLRGRTVVGSATVEKAGG